MSEQVNSLRLRKLLGVTNGQLNQWLEEGVPYANTEYGKRFDVAEVFNWREQANQRALKERADDNPDEMSIGEAKRREAIASMTMKEVDVKVKRDQLSPIHLMIEELGDALVNVRAKLVPLATKMGGLCAHKDEDYITEKIDKEVQQILNDLSDYQHEMKDRGDKSG